MLSCDRQKLPALARGAIWFALTLLLIPMARSIAAEEGSGSLLQTEKLPGEDVWAQPALEQVQGNVRLRVTVWFEDQLLGDGQAYLRRAKEFAGSPRSELRARAIRTLKAASDQSYQRASAALDKLIADEQISDLERHWIVNGVSCTITPAALTGLKSVPGVKKIFTSGRAGGPLPPQAAAKPQVVSEHEQVKFDPERFQHPWYVHYLLADQVWKKFGITGEGTLNIVHDFNFVYSDNTLANLYHNPDEIPANGKDDDGNGLVDDAYGYNFDARSAQLTLRQVPESGFVPQLMHAFMCASIICGSGAEGRPYEFGLAPRGRWAGVIASSRIEAAVEWAVEQGADTYSMSFSRPNLGEYRSHWRKLMEHGSLCGVYFVSGAGNFAQQVPVPVQMRVPEDIPEVVFAAAGVQRDFSRTPFSSQGPVEWKTEHYQDGRVNKPEVCAFNAGLPALKRDGTVLDSGLNGNSFAGPMFCGTIALMLSADPELLPWDLKQIITSTATDVADPGVDSQTGHGLINAYRAVKEVLRRKALREGRDPKPYEGREPNDEPDLIAIGKQLARTQLAVARVQPGSNAAAAGIQAGDIVVSYNGQAIHSRNELLAAKQQADADKLAEVKFVVERNGQREELTLKAGPLGIFPALQYQEPTFK